MEKQIDQLTDECAKICWYMRGSISWEESHTLSMSQRKVINNVIKDNIETVKKTKMPLL
tara:strand:+ start:322 stop:498 length:177 start_codon:yes stop_codon:yes gene_type:complete